MDAGDDEEVRSGKFLEYVVDARRKLEALLVLRHGSRMPTRLRDGERLSRRRGEATAYPRATGGRDIDAPAPQTENLIEVGR
jgi:hypothetical protein